MGQIKTSKNCLFKKNVMLKYFDAQILYKKPKWAMLPPHYRVNKIVNKADNYNSVADFYGLMTEVIIRC